MKKFITSVFLSLMVAVVGAIIAKKGALELVEMYFTVKTYTFMQGVYLLAWIVLTILMILISISGIIYFCQTIKAMVKKAMWCISRKNYAMTSTPKRFYDWSKDLDLQ